MRELEKARRQGRGRRGAGARLSANRAFVETARRQPWAQGAAGEEYVASLLDSLQTQGWTALHDLKVGPQGPPVDHLVIGPAGVFVLDTRWVSGPVRVEGERIRVNTFPQNYLEHLEARVRDVHDRLLAASGRRALEVRGLLVFVEPELTVKAPPAALDVISDAELLLTLMRRPACLTSREIADLTRLARRAATWTVPREM
ncbi:nuclease-related domain-containing protein [Melittangium boletus]|uniref:nuclease-related domain-containing protein n=1 Tax=Melittangium boletus TaxID=83453 RepID=UPI003DA6A5B4